MEFIALAVLGALWAAFLLPSFLEGRREAPLASTRSFDQKLAKLAALSPLHSNQSARQRVRRQRRRRVLILLVIASLSAIVAAVTMQSVALLVVSLIVDALLVAYVLVLLRLRDVTASEVVIPLPQRDPSASRARMAARR